MTDHLVVARLRPRTPNEPPRFTRMGTTQELLTELQGMLPADTAYVVVPDPDGMGFSFREAFRIQLTVTPSVDHGRDVPRAAVLAQPEPLPPPTPFLGPKSYEDEMEGGDGYYGAKEVHNARRRQDAPDLTLPKAAPIQFNSAGFERPRSQAELLAERGIKETRITLMPPKPVIPTLTKGGRKGKKGQPVQDPNDRDDPSIPDDKLPVTKSSRSRSRPQPQR